MSGKIPGVEDSKTIGVERECVCVRAGGVGGGAGRGDYRR